MYDGYDISDEDRVWAVECLLRAKGTKNPAEARTWLKLSECFLLVSRLQQSAEPAYLRELQFCSHQSNFSVHGKSERGRP